MVREGGLGYFGDEEISRARGIGWMCLVNESWDSWRGMRWCKLALMGRSRSQSRRDLAKGGAVRVTFLSMGGSLGRGGRSASCEVKDS